MYTDTHAHLYKEYYSELNTIINDAENVKVNRFFVSGANHLNNKEVMFLVKQYKNIYGTLSIHPEYATSYKDSDLNYIEKNLMDKKIIAIGEIGLDYHWSVDNQEEQKDLFRKQILLAIKYNKPVIIHSREATKETIEILKQYPQVKGVIHAFSGSLETALIYVKMGYCLGIGGLVTFKNCKLKNYLKQIPIDNIVLETDCPYLTPHPFRGTQNEPKYIALIAEFVSEIYGISKSQLSKITNANIRRIFDI